MTIRFIRLAHSGLGQRFVITPTAAEFKGNFSVCLCQAYLLLYSRKASEAKEAFQAALTVANDSVRALTGLVEADLHLKPDSEAKNQRDFLEATVNCRSSFPHPMEVLMRSERSNQATRHSRGDNRTPVALLARRDECEQR
jgi:hypothetical protein